MKALYLLRHATPVSPSAGRRDAERPLAKIGFREAASAGERISASSATETVDDVICSSAQRTVDTLNQVLPHLSPSVSVSVEDSLYCASQRQLIDRISAVESDANGLLVIAHNPGIAILAASLSSQGDPPLIDRVSNRFPAGALAILALPIDDWFELETTAGRLVDLWFPPGLG